VGLTIIGLRARLQDEQQHPSVIDSSQPFIHAAEETKALLNQLSQVYSSIAIVGAKAIEAIEGNPALKVQIINALEVGGTTAFETLVDHPAVGIVTAAVKGNL
jgi:hypothetical protein